METGLQVIQYYLLILANLLILLVSIRNHFSKNSPFLAFWYFYTAVYFIPSAFDFGKYSVTLHPLLPIFYPTDETVLKAQIFILFVISSLFLLENLIFLKKLKNEPVYTTSKRNTAELVFYTIIYFMFIFGNLNFVLRHGINLSFDELREKISIFDLILIQYNSYILGAFGGFYFNRGNYIRFFSVISLLTFSILLIGGSRQSLIISFIIVFFGILNKRKFGIFYLYLSIALIPLSLFVSRVMIFFRNIDGFENRIEFIRNGDYSLIDNATSVESNVRYMWYYIMQNEDLLQNSLFKYEYVKRIVLFFVPSFMFPGLKPDDFEYTLYESIYGTYGGSAQITFFGTIYSDTGYNIIPWIVLFGIFEGLYVYISNRVQEHFKFVIWSIFVYLSTMWARGSIYAPILVLSYSAALIFAFSIFAGRKGRAGSVGAYERLSSNRY
jgi:hypothetical protein